MAITIGNGVLVAVIAIAILFVTAYFAFQEYNFDNTKKALKISVTGVIVAVLVSGLTLFAMDWWNTNTASGIRSYKDFQSEMDNGLYREVVITAEDGREIFKYEGKFDVERHAEGDDRYLRFETEDGKRYTISYGIQDTVLIIEKDSPSKK